MSDDSATSGAREAEARISATFVDVERWVAQMGVAWLPAPGSDLAIDDATWSYHIPTSQLARAGLLAGTDNLRAVCQQILHRHISAFATESLLRAAVLGGAQGLWILEPNDRATRIERARSLTTYAQENELVYLGVESRQPGEQAKHAEVRRSMLKLSHDALLRRRAEEANDKAKFSSTTVIQEAGRTAFGEGGDDAAELYWRMSSGFAHGLPWGVSLRPDRTEQVIVEGHTTHGIRPTADRLQNGYSIAFGFLKVGWTLLNRRGTAATDACPEVLAPPL